jgi:hypothetical protein
MRQSPLGKANSASARHEITRTLHNLKVIAVSRSVCPLLLLLNNMTSVHTLPSYLSCILMLSFHLCLGPPKCSVQVSPPNPCVHVSQVLPIWSFLISPEQYLTRSTHHEPCSSCSFLQYLVTSSVFCPNIFLSTCSQATSAHVAHCERPSNLNCMCVVTTIHSPSPEAISDTAGSTVT